MKTYSQFLKESVSGYQAYVISDKSRKELLHRFPPKNPEVIAHHITVKFPAKDTDTLPPEPRSVKVVGYAEEDGLQAAVVEINGSTKRPDGKIWHVTIALNKSKGKKPVHSNNLVANGFQKVQPFEIEVTPTFIPNN